MVHRRLFIALLSVLFLGACTAENGNDNDSTADDDDSTADDDDSAADDDDSAADDDASAADDDDSAADDDDSADGLVFTTLNAVSATTTDANVDFRDTMAPPDAPTAAPTTAAPTPAPFVLESSVPGIAACLNPVWSFFGMSVGDVLEGGWSVMAPADTVTPLPIEFTITGRNLHPEDPCGGESFEPPCINSTPFLFSATIE